MSLILVMLNLSTCSKQLITMSTYNSKINALETEINNLNKKIISIKNDPNHDTAIVENLNREQHRMLSEIRRLARLQWEEDNERVGYEDDR